MCCLLISTGSSQGKSRRNRHETAPSSDSAALLFPKPPPETAMAARNLCKASRRPHVPEEGPKSDPRRREIARNGLMMMM